MSLNDWILEICPSPSTVHRDAAARRQTQLTKPPGSLGRLEDVAIALAGLQASETPSGDHAAIVLFAGDHGVTAQGISAFPSAVTVEMLRNFARGGAAISVLARNLGVPLSVIDAGTLADTPMDGVTTDKCRNGTEDFSALPAMSADDRDFALACGRRAVEGTATNGGRKLDLILFGEMGIGNTTAAAAMAAALIGVAAGTVVGAGTGLDAAGRKHKTEVVSKALALHGLVSPQPDGLSVLQRVGGLEIAALTGGIIAAAQAGVPVLVDGFIVSMAALAAEKINPSVRPWLLFSHRSQEQGHGVVLDALDARPLLDLDLRLGEGSGAAIALPLIRSACALHNGMATFAEAAVSDGS